MSGTPLDLVFPAIGAGAAVVNAGYSMIRGEANAHSATTKPSENPYLEETKTVQTRRHNHYGTSMYRELPGGGFMAASQGDNSGGYIITSTTTTHTAVYGFPKQRANGKWWR